MNLRCAFGIHDWRNTGEATFTPPQAGKVWGTNEELALLMVFFGFTTIRQKCRRCPKARNLREAGDQTAFYKK